MIYSAITKIQKFARGVIVRKQWNMILEMKRELEDFEKNMKKGKK
jgi:hypothetical protein